MNFVSFWNLDILKITFFGAWYIVYDVYLDFEGCNWLLLGKKGLRFFHQNPHKPMNTSYLGKTQWEPQSFHDGSLIAGISSTGEEPQMAFINQCGVIIWLFGGWKYTMWSSEKQFWSADCSILAWVAGEEAENVNMAMSDESLQSDFSYSRRTPCLHHANSMHMHLTADLQPFHLEWWAWLIAW